MLTKNKLSKDIQRWGSSASIKSLEQSTCIFTHDTIEGFIGYQKYGRCYAVFGDPVSNDKKGLAEAFHTWCNVQRKRVVYITISEDFAMWLYQNRCKTILEIGEEFVVDTYIDMKAGSSGRLLRRKTTHAKNAGVEVHELHSKDKTVWLSIQELAKGWVQRRRGKQIYYAPIEVFEDMEKKRCFYASKEHQIVGAILLYYLESSQRWIVHMLMLSADAPHGTPEILISTLKDVLQKEGSSFLSFGFVQAQELGYAQGLSRYKRFFAKGIFKMAMALFSLDGRRTFWKKFGPSSERVFVASSKPMGLAELIAIKKTFHV